MAVGVDGLDTLLRFLKDSDPKMRAAIQQGLKAAAEPVLTAARANARRIEDDGTLERSLSIRQTGRGVVKLVSTDPAAPVKEFANKGAVTRSSKGTKLAEARLRKKSGVGVPLRSNPPRAMVRALNDNVEQVKNRIDEHLEEVLRRADG